VKPKKALIILTELKRGLRKAILKYRYWWKCGRPEIEKDATIRKEVLESVLKQILKRERRK
jgi:hypothetical protein